MPRLFVLRKLRKGVDVRLSRAYISDVTRGTYPATANGVFKMSTPLTSKERALAANAMVGIASQTFNRVMAIQASPSRYVVEVESAAMFLSSDAKMNTYKLGAFYEANSFSPASAAAEVCTLWNKQHGKNYPAKVVEQTRAQRKAALAALEILKNATGCAADFVAEME